MRYALLLLASLLPGFTASKAADPAEFQEPTNLGAVAGYGRNIQRTMRLLAESTPEDRNTVRVLFYGQSITEQGWWKLVADDLKKRFPNADLMIENRAIGGHSSQLLVKTAEADLYPFYPDLLIFHVYGAHDKYEDIIRSVRQRTTAEILQQNDHVTKPDDFNEETDAAKLAPGKASWDAFMNHNWLPAVSRKYSTELCDQRGLWKQYLKEAHLEPKDLLKDNVHLNPNGEKLMARFVSAYLRFDPLLGPSPAEQWVKTLTVGKDLEWKEGKLTLEFEGNRVDAIAKAGATATANVLIDGRKPSELPGVRNFTRSSPYPHSNWPCLLKIGSEKPLQREEWTLTMHDVAPDLKSFKFDVTGSSTGPDGSGERGARFVSNSGRVIIEPEDWNLEYCLAVFKTPVEDGFQVKWKVEPHYADQFAPPPAGRAGSELLITLAQGMPNGKHTLEISGSREAIAAIRIYTPPLK